MKHNYATWLVVFDSTVCRMYQYGKNKITLINEIDHPENKLKDTDISADRPGRYQSKGTGHGTYAQPTNPKEIKVELFSKEIAKVLDHNRNHQAYKQLILAGLPHMKGLVNKHINKEVKKLVCQDIEKDLVHFKESQLLNYVKQATVRR